MITSLATWLDRNGWTLSDKDYPLRNFVLYSRTGGTDELRLPLNPDDPNYEDDLKALLASLSKAVHRPLEDILREILLTEPAPIVELPDGAHTNDLGESWVLEHPDGRMIRLSEAHEDVFTTQVRGHAPVKPNGVERIAAERRRQIEEEGWAPEHDVAHSNGSLAEAAACYASHEYRGGSKLPPPNWPWGGHWWKPGDRLRELTKAGALIAAEIDRIQASEDK